MRAINASVFAITLIAGSIGSAQAGAPDCAGTGEPIKRESLVGRWAWEDETRQGRHRFWVEELYANGHRDTFGRIFPSPGATDLDSFIIDSGNFGRWFVTGRIFSDIQDGAYRAGDPRNGKVYWVESEDLPDANSMLIGRITANSVELCFGENGQHYATLRRVGPEYRLPESNSGKVPR